LQLTKETVLGISIYLWLKGKGNFNPRTGHEGPEGE